MPKCELFRLRTESKMLRWEGERFAAIAGEHRFDSLGPASALPISSTPSASGQAAYFD